MANTRLDRTPSSASNPTQFTISFWFKRTKIGANQQLFGQQNSNYFRVYLNSDNFLMTYSGTGSMNLKPTMKFVDPNAWYHYYLSVNTGAGTASDRAELRINGVEPVLTTSDYPTQNSNLPIFNTSKHCIGGSDQSGGGDYFDGLISHFHIVDGSNIAYTQFGSVDTTSGEWKIETSPTVASYGTNGFTVLKDGNTITDQSPNSNNWSLGSGTLTATEDCPSDIFCTFNPLHQGVPSRELIYSNGNGTITASTNNWQPSGSTLAVPPKTGKWYWEFSQFVSSQFFVGLMASNCNINVSLPYEALGLITYFQSGRLTKDNSATESYFTAISNQTDVVGVALDMTAGTYGQVQFYHNGSATGSAVALTSNFANQFVMPFGMCNGSTRSVSLNTGNGYFGTVAISSEGTNASGIGKFEHDVPANHKPISTKGLNA